MTNGYDQDQRSPQELAGGVSNLFVILEQSFDTQDWETALVTLQELNRYQDQQILNSNQKRTLREAWSEYYENNPVVIEPKETQRPYLSIDQLAAQGKLSLLEKLIERELNQEEIAATTKFNPIVEKMREPSKEPNEARIGKILTTIDTEKLDEAQKAKLNKLRTQALRLFPSLSNYSETKVDLSNYKNRLENAQAALDAAAAEADLPSRIVNIVTAAEAITALNGVDLSTDPGLEGQYTKLVQRLSEISPVLGTAIVDRFEELLQAIALSTTQKELDGHTTEYSHLNQVIHDNDVVAALQLKIPTNLDERIQKATESGNAKVKEFLLAEQLKVFTQRVESLKAVALGKDFDPTAQLTFEGNTYPNLRAALDALYAQRPASDTLDDINYEIEKLRRYADEFVTAQAVQTMSDDELDTTHQVFVARIAALRGEANPDAGYIQAYEEILQNLDQEIAKRNAEKGAAIQIVFTQNILRVAQSTTTDLATTFSVNRVGKDENLTLEELIAEARRQQEVIANQYNNLQTTYGQGLYTQFTENQNTIEALERFVSVFKDIDVLALEVTSNTIDRAEFDTRYTILEKEIATINDSGLNQRLMEQLQKIPQPEEAFGFRHYMNLLDVIEKRLTILGKELATTELNEIARDLVFNSKTFSEEQYNEIAAKMVSLRQKLQGVTTHSTESAEVTETQPAGSSDLEKSTSVQALKESTTKYDALVSAAEGGSQTFDPRAQDADGQIPLTILHSDIEGVTDILPTRGNDINLNAKIRVVETQYLKPAQTLEIRMRNLAKNIDEKKVNAWETQAPQSDLTNELATIKGTTVESESNKPTLETQITQIDNIVAQIDGLLSALPANIVDPELGELRSAFPGENFDFLYTGQRKFLTGLRTQFQEEATRRRNRIAELEKNVNRETEFINQVARVRSMLDVARHGGVQIDIHHDSVTENYERVEAELENLEKIVVPSRHHELEDLKRDVYKSEIESRSKALALVLYSIENREIGPGAISSENESIIKRAILGRIDTLIALVEAAGETDSELDRLKKLRKDLENHKDLRIICGFMWTGGAKTELFTGNSSGSRRVSPNYNQSDHPLTGEHVLQILNEPPIEGFEGSNVIVGMRTERMKAILVDSCNKEVMGVAVQFSPIPGTDEVEVRYPETAAAWIFQILDKIYDLKGNQREIQIAGIPDPVRVPNNAEGNKISTGNIHKSYNELFDFIMEIEKERASRLNPPSEPRFDKALVQRIFRLHIMATWNHVALASSSVEGLSDMNYYTMDWPTYAIKERAEGVAKYNLLATAFLFGYGNFSPWKLLGDDFEKKVADVLKKQHHGHEYNYLRYSFINLVNTSTSKTPHYTVFSPPLRSKEAAFKPNGSPMRRVVNTQQGPQEGMILTMDDIRSVDGSRLYQLMPLEKLGAMASIYTGFGKNATTVVEKILMTDVGKWDGETLINELRKDAKYSLPFFPKVGLEISNFMRNGDKVPYEIFLDKFTTYLVLIKCIMILAPEEFLNGQGKDMRAVESYLVKQKTRGVISEETVHVLTAILKKLYSMEVFTRELGEKIMHQFENYFKFQA